MIPKILRFIDSLFPPKPVYAHCDIPCGIYDPHNAQIGAHTVVRMVDLINDVKLDLSTKGAKEAGHKIARYTLVKEQHAELVKHEVRIIWGDYFKPEHIEKFPILHQLVFDIMKLSSKSRQEVDAKAAEDLLAKVQAFAEIFWKTKDIAPRRVKAPYPSGGEMILPD